MEMNDLNAFIGMNDSEKQSKMSSREIAELTGKQHKHVMRDIRDMEPAWEKISQSKFGLTCYVDRWNRKKPMYELSKAECLYIATKFNDEARAKLIIRWEKLENRSALDFSDPRTAVILAKKSVILAQNWEDEYNKRLEAEAKVKGLLKENETMKPKVEFMEQIFNTKQMVDIGQAAKILQLPFGRNTLFKQLRERGVFFKYRNEPRQQYINSKYFEVREGVVERSGEKIPFVKVFVTQRGLKFIAELFNMISPEDNEVALT
jgi:Rha family phage regulatory protein